MNLRSTTKDNQYTLCCRKPRSVTVICYFGLIFFATILIATPGSADDWPGWRGDGSGVSDAEKLPTEWSNEKNVIWKTPIEGEGISSPIVFGNNVFVTTAVEGSERTVAFFVIIASGLLWIVAIVLGLLVLNREDRQRAPLKPFWKNLIVRIDQILTYGIMSCLDAETGDLVWKKRLKARGRYMGSLMAGSGMIFVPCESGQVVVVQASREFSILSENDIGEQLFSSPAAAGGRIFIRGKGNLYCIGNEARQLR